VALQDPIAVYNAASNMEAHFLREALVNAGIEAFVTEDVSVVGQWFGGLIPEIHKPQVWVERVDIERTKPVLEAYERNAGERRAARDQAASGASIDVICEACGKSTTFPAVLLGSVERCGHCRAYVDVEGEQEPNREASIDVICEECGKTTTFPAVLRGLVEQCSYCKAYVDVEG
jgi:hypothetical protein